MKQTLRVNRINKTKKSRRLFIQEKAHVIYCPPLLSGGNWRRAEKMGETSVHTFHVCGVSSSTTSKNSQDKKSCRSIEPNCWRTCISGCSFSVMWTTRRFASTAFMSRSLEHAQQSITVTSVSEEEGCIGEQESKRVVRVVQATTKQSEVGKLQGRRAHVNTGSLFFYCMPSPCSTGVIRSEHILGHDHET